MCEKNRQREEQTKTFYDRDQYLFMRLCKRAKLLRLFVQNFSTYTRVYTVSGGELLEIRLLDNHLLDTFGRKSTARHKIYQLLESSKSWLNWIRADDKNIVNCSNPVLNCCRPFFLINYFTETARIQSARHFLQLKMLNILNWLFL